jgi:poly(hydroxyalkanoate) granule-associated protein
MSADPHHTPGLGSVADLQAQASRIAREMGENAHQVWLAGIGALARAQGEGSRLFEQLAEEGRQVEDGAAPDSGAASRLEGLRQSLDAAMGRAQARAGEAWESVGRVFEQRVQQALRHLDVPTRDDLDALGARIDALTRELQRTRSEPATHGPAASNDGGATTTAG